MDISAIIIIWVVIAVIQSVFEKKKPTSNPPPQNGTENLPDFEIPTLANDPNFPGEENSILIQDSTQSAEVREVDLAELYRQKKLFAQTENKITALEVQVQKQIPEVAQKKFTLDLTPSATMNAIVLGEILSKPKFRK